MTQKTLTQALINAKEQFDTIEKNGKGKVRGQTKTGTSYEYEYQYALLEDVIKATDPHLANNGLLVTESTEIVGTQIFVKIILSHKDGESIACSLPALVGETKRNDMQALGAAISYARRYGRCLLLGVVAEQDDDGSRARDSDAKKKKADKLKIDSEDKSRTAGSKKEYFKKYLEEITNCDDEDSLDLYIVSQKEDLEAVLSTYSKEVRETTEENLDARIAARRKELRQ